MPTRTGPPTVAGRWSRLPERETERRPGGARARAEALLDRHGVLTRGAVMAEQVPGGFSAVYPVLRAFEETGRARRGYFVEALGRRPVRHCPARSTGCARFAAPDRAPPAGAVVLAATDPANLYGAALPWPERPAAGDPRRSTSARAPAAGGDRPPAGRKAGALVVLVDGELVLYVERGGKTLLSWTEDEHVLKEAADGAVQRGRGRRAGPDGRAEGRRRVGARGDAAVGRAAGGRLRRDPERPAPARLSTAWAVAAGLSAGRVQPAGEEPGERRHHHVRHGDDDDDAESTSRSSSGHEARCGTTSCWNMRRDGEDRDDRQQRHPPPGSGPRRPR